MSAYFCGNPFNHEAHEKNGMQCDGVGRVEVKDEVVVEKYEPKLASDMAEDGTEYSKVTILIEDIKTGDVTILHAEKASLPRTEVKSRSYLPLDQDMIFTGAEIDFLRFEFRPHVEDHHPAFTIERKKNNDGPGNVTPIR